MQKGGFGSYFHRATDSGDKIGMGVYFMLDGQDLKKKHVIEQRHKLLDAADINLDKLEKYIKENPEALPVHHGELIVPQRLVNVGTKMIIKLISYEGNNAAFMITEDCFGTDAVPQPYVIHLEKNGDIYCQEIELIFDVPGNTKLEFWVGGERIVRQVAVIEKGYMLVIPWVGSNRPQIDEEIHRYDIPGDYWMNNPKVEEDPAQTIKKWYDHIKNHHKYGDRTACFINARTLIPGCETDSLFELDYETQNRGLRQMYRQMCALGYEGMELLASYTPGADTLEILEKIGVKGLTSLCAWQNWQDHGWKINHCGVANQPYYPAPDDFRRAGDKRDIMCFTMGNANCNRNYSIMAFDGNVTSMIPGERYFDHRVIHYNIQRFYDIFDGYIADSKNNQKPLIVTIALEAFRGFMDWNATNDLAVRYMVKKAATEKIVFTSAADVADYHYRFDLGMQEAYFFQPDYYYGYHNGELPGRVDDRIEADTEEYLAVVRRGQGIPMYFYDYTIEWNNPGFEDTERNEFGLVNPDTHKPSECYPRQVYTEDMSVNIEMLGEKIKIGVDSETIKEKMVTGVFDVPFASDFEARADKKDVRLQKVTDHWTGNTHLFVDLGRIESGHTDVVITVSGTSRIPVEAECIKDNFAVIWFGDHGYMRCTDKDTAIKVKMDAPDTAYIFLHNGEKILSQNGVLEFVVNEEWFNEAPMLRGFGRDAFESALHKAQIEIVGQTKCSRWSGQ